MWFFFSLFYFPWIGRPQVISKMKRKKKKKTKMAEIRRNPCHCFKIVHQWIGEKKLMNHILFWKSMQMPEFKGHKKNSANKQNKNKYLKVDLFCELLSKPSLVANIRLRTHLRALFLWRREKFSAHLIALVRTVTKQHFYTINTIYSCAYGIVRSVWWFF